jgi:molecular chaperone IbpA
MWVNLLTCLTKEIIMTFNSLFPNNGLIKMDEIHNHFVKHTTDIFDNIFDSWSKIPSFPFYNVVKYGKGKYGLEIGLAGYNKENVLVEVKDGILTIEGKVEDKNIDYVQKGLAFRKFIKQFELASNVIIDEAEMVDGLLKIKLGVKNPELHEGKKIKVK